MPKIFRKNLNLFVFALTLGLFLAIGVSVWATSVGTNVSVSGTLTSTGNATLSGNLTVSGNSTLGDAGTDVNLFTGTLQASTTALFTTGLTTYGNSTFGDAATDVNLFTGTLQASTTALFTTGFTTYGNWVIDNTTSKATTTVTFNQGGINFDSGTWVLDPDADRVGVATTAPFGKFSVENTGTENSLIVNDQAADASPFVVGPGGNVGVATSTPGQELAVAGDGLFHAAAGTTTLVLSSDVASTGGCIQLRGANGTMFRIYAGATTTNYGFLVVEAGACQ